MQDQEFWHSKWAANKIGFHLADVNPLLPQFWSHLQPKQEHNVLVPLCGKSEDLIWLATQHQSVTGVELSNIAVRAFFAEHLYTPTVTSLNNLHELYQFDELSIYSGDFFTAPLESYDLIYDRAAMIALPPALRVDYVARIKSLMKPNGKILLIGLDYDQNEMQGPPFSVPEDEIRAMYAGMKVTRLQRDEASANHPKIENGLSRFAEEVWLIEN
ncbi:MULTISPECIES: thiopurine S-methyltransferase [Vibrio]|uniref:Thiopurine S-methyltransferase n=1 Tax=Vibrio algicola TaxID=2662262 RepID=A0A5Q0TCX5_9VIBR|nr:MULTISPECIES: thiopurine S-methyltransferase [Vibrio]MBD1575670.1 thiopurine S-methyltransferase [Vibrio sp. S11_S32]